MNFSKKKTASFFKSWSDFKNNFGHFIKDNNFQDIQKNIKKTVQTVQDDMSHLIDKDLKLVKQRFLKEKKDMEKIIDKVVLVEIKRAKKFIATQRKEVDRLQDKLEDLMKKASMQNKTKSGAKSTAKSPVRKKAKTVAKTVAKPSVKKAVRKTKTTTGKSHS